MRANAARAIAASRVESAAHSPDDAILVGDASYSPIWLGCSASRPGTRRGVLPSRRMAGAGWRLPLALGAKAAVPDHPVIWPLGEGGRFGHGGAELETPVREGLPAVVFNNVELGCQKHAEMVQFGHAASGVALRADIMTFDDVDHFRQRMADCRYEFELPRASDFALEGRSQVFAGPVCWAVSG